MLPNNQAKNNRVWEFFFFKSYDHFREENACSAETQGLTACQKQTRQVISISRQACQEDSDVDQVLVLKFDQK